MKDARVPVALGMIRAFQIVDDRVAETMPPPQPLPQAFVVSGEEARRRTGKTRPVLLVEPQGKERLWLTKDQLKHVMSVMETLEV